VTLHYRVEGTAGAPWLLLLNSIGTATAMWDPCAGPLGERFRLIRVDARGHGGSPPAPPLDRPATLADLGADVLAVLDEVGADRVHLAGVSLGAMTGMWLAIHHPERIGRLALICTSANMDSARMWADRGRAVRAAGSLEVIADVVIGRWLTPEFTERDPAAAARLRGMLTATDAESYAQCGEAIGAMNLVPDLHRIAAPTLVVGAAQDPATPPEQQRVIAEHIPGARLEFVSPSSHIATYEQPAELVRLLLAHLLGGEQTRREVLGDAHVDAATPTAFSADFQDFITRYAWGEVWSRPGLGRRDRSIATLAAVITLGAEEEIAMHVRAARRNGLSDPEIAEVILHTSLYAGLPRANRAYAIAQRVLSGG
jgi:3-oxoadipate enol-lactonase / 4-carboxymuconolactone decarboxylase